MEQFKVGDRVKCISGDSCVKLNATGVIADINSELYSNKGVRWDYYDLNFHDCNGKCEHEYGYYMADYQLQHIDPLGWRTTSFKVGDRVVCHGTQDTIDINGHTGIVKSLAAGPTSISVEFINPFHTDLHSCDGACKPGHGYYIDPKNLKLMNINVFPSQAAAGGSFINVITNHSSIPASGFAGYAPIQGYLTQPLAQGAAPMQYTTIAQQWAPITETPPPSPYLHKEAAYIGKTQQFNAIIHNKQIDEFLLLN